MVLCWVGSYFVCNDLLVWIARLHIFAKSGDLMICLTYSLNFIFFHQHLSCMGSCLFLFISIKLYYRFLVWEPTFHFALNVLKKLRIIVSFLQSLSPSAL